MAFLRTKLNLQHVEDDSAEEGEIYLKVRKNKSFNPKDSRPD